MSRFLYLPRLKGPEVLLRSIDDGVSLITWEQETFAFAESFDEDAGRYRALRVQESDHLARSKLLRDCSSSPRWPGSSSMRGCRKARETISNQALLPLARTEWG